MTYHKSIKNKNPVKRAGFKFSLLFNETKWCNCSFWRQIDDKF